MRQEDYPLWAEAVLLHNLGPLSWAVNCTRWAITPILGAAGRSIYHTLESLSHKVQPSPKILPAECAACTCLASTRGEMEFDAEYTWIQRCKSDLLGFVGISRRAWTWMFPGTPSCLSFLPIRSRSWRSWSLLSLHTSALLEQVVPDQQELLLSWHCDHGGGPVRNLQP